MSQTDKVAHAFLTEYYGTLHRNPSDLAGMYHEYVQHNISFTRVSTPHHTTPHHRDAKLVVSEGTFSTQEAIAEYLSRPQVSRKYRIHGVGCYESVSNSLLVLVKGTQLTAEGSSVFQQSFVLACTDDNKTAYCIQNDATTEFQAAAPKAPVAEPAVEAVPEPVVEEAVVEEPVAVEEPTPTPEPKKAATPVQKPAEPVPEPVVEEEPVGPASCWAARARQAKSAEAPAVQASVVRGGAVPQTTAAAPKEEKKDPRGPKRTETKYSVFVSMPSKEFKDTDVETLFKKFGKVVGKTLKAEQNYCFVDFAEKKAMDAAVEASQKGSILFAGGNVKCMLRSDKRPTADKPKVGAAAAPVNRYVVLILPHFSLHTHTSQAQVSVRVRRSRRRYRDSLRPVITFFPVETPK